MWLQVVSDFLSKFSNESYAKINNDTTSAQDSILEKENLNKDDSDKMKSAVQKNISDQQDKIIPDSKEVEKTDTTKMASLLNDSQNVDKQDETENSSKLSGIAKEEYVKDEGYAKKLLIKRIMIALAAIIGLVLLILIGMMLLTTRMPNFVESKTIDEMKLWAVQNKVTLNIKEEFSLTVDNNYIIDQGREVNSIVRKGSSFDVIVSKGADPDELIALPDFKKMTLSEIEKWKLENRADNVSILKEFSNDIPKDSVIRYEIKSQDVTPQTYARKDRLTVYVSKGVEVFEKDIVVPDFTNMQKSEVEAWAKKNEIDMKYNEAASDTVMAGAVLSQSIEPETKIARNDEMTVTVSVGRILYAPSFFGLSQDDALALSMQKGVSITIVEKYSSTHNAGTLMTQSISPRHVIPQTEPTIVLVYSIGLPYIDDYRGQSHQVAVDAINQMNARGANLTYNIVTIQDSNMDKGFVIMATPTNGFVGVGTHITITISAGGQAVIPDFVGKSMSSQEVIDNLARLESQGLRVVTQFVPNGNYPVGTIFEQSIRPNTNVNTFDVFLVLKIAN